MYTREGLSPQEATEAYRRAATRPPAESGTPRKEPPADLTIPQLQAELVKAGYAFKALEVEILGLKGQLEAAQKEIAEQAARLTATSGVTEVGRDHETLLKIQKSDVVQRNTIWNLEATLGAQRRTIESLQDEVKSLRKACAPTRQRDIEEATVFEAEHKAAPRLRQIGDVLPDSAA